MTEKMRAFWIDGKRRGVRLDNSTWHALDWLAAQRGAKWSDMARDWLGQSDDSNVTRTIRQQTIDGLMIAAIHGESRIAHTEAMDNHPHMATSSTLNDSQLEEELAAGLVQGNFDLVGFAVIFGHDQHGQPSTWIKNGLRDELHFVITTPKQ